MKKCSKCKKNATITTVFAENNYCDAHFLDMIEKRIRKDLRTKQPINLKETYFLKESNEQEYTIAKYFLKKIFGEHLKLSTNKKYKAIIPVPADIVAGEFITSFLENTTKKINDAINPIKTVLESEIKEICRIINKEYKCRKGNSIIEALERNYPGTVFSALKSEEALVKNKKK